MLPFADTFSTAPSMRIDRSISPYQNVKAANYDGNDVNNVDNDDVNNDDNDDVNNDDNDDNDDADNDEVMKVPLGLANSSCPFLEL